MRLLYNFNFPSSFLCLASLHSATELTRYNISLFRSTSVVYTLYSRSHVHHFLPYCFPTLARQPEFDDLMPEHLVSLSQIHQWPLSVILSQMVSYQLYQILSLWYCLLSTNPLHPPTSCTAHLLYPWLIFIYTACLNLCCFITALYL